MQIRRSKSSLMFYASVTALVLAIPAHGGGLAGKSEVNSEKSNRLKATVTNTAGRGEGGKSERPLVFQIFGGIDYAQYQALFSGPNSPFDRPYEIMTRDNEYDITNERNIGAIVKTRSLIENWGARLSREALRRLGNDANSPGVVSGSVDVLQNGAVEVHIIGRTGGKLADQTRLCIERLAGSKYVKFPDELPVRVSRLGFVFELQILEPSHQKLVLDCLGDSSAYAHSGCTFNSCTGVAPIDQFADAAP